MDDVEGLWAFSRADKDIEGLRRFVDNAAEVPSPKEL